MGRPAVPNTHILKLGPRKRRQGYSCDACFVRKIRCDNAKPKCDWCSHHDSIPCTYYKHSHLDKTNLQGYYSVSVSSSRYDFVSSRSTCVTSGNPIPSNPEQGPSSLQINPVSKDQTEIPGDWMNSRSCDDSSIESHLGNICTFDGTHVLSENSKAWIKSITGEDISLSPFPEARNAEKPLTGIRIAYHDSILPEKDFVFRQLDCYQGSIFGKIFPILDSSLFQKTVAAAYRVPPTGDGTFKTANACIYALLALTLVSNSGDSSNFQSGKRYYENALSLVPDLLKEPPTLDGLQTLLLLCLCTQGLTGKIEDIKYFLSACADHIFFLGAHLTTNKVHINPTRSDHHARHLFWVTYICDKGFSLVTGFPHSLPDERCDVVYEDGTPPASSLKQPSHRVQPHCSSDPVPGSYVCTYLRLAVIQSRIHDLLYTRDAVHLDQADILQIIRNLDHDLEQWRLSVPADYRPSFTTYLGNDERLRSINSSIFHLQYHHCMIMIHQTSTRCSLWKQNQNTLNATSSLGITVTASRNLLGSFLESRFDLGPQNLLFCLSYFMQASFNLFCKVLSQTSDDSNFDDIILITNISKVIEEHLKRDAPDKFEGKIAFVPQFVSELSRLGERTLLKSLEREKR